MHYAYKVSNFCERRLFPSQPEYINSISALYISFIGLRNILSIKNQGIGPITSTIYWCIFINGFSSFAYHWTGWYIYKLADEFSMIIPIYLGLIEVTYSLNYPPIIIGILTIYNFCLIILDTLIWFEPYFQIAFAAEILLLIPLYKKSIRLRRDNKLLGLKGIIISSSSGLFWLLTEVNCSKYLVWGHAVWHIGMSTGLSYLIQYFSSKTKI